MEALMLYHLRQASGLIDARRWIDAVPGLRWMTSGSLLVVWLSGGYLAERTSVWSLAWPKVALAVILLLGALTGMSFRRIRAIRRMYDVGETTDAEFAKRLNESLLKLSLGIRAGLIFGVILIMTAKPPMLESLAILGSSIVAVLMVVYFGSVRQIDLRNSSNAPSNQPRT
jgi:hypothetical protein